MVFGYDENEAIMASCDRKDGYITVNLNSFMRAYLNNDLLTVEYYLLHKIRYAFQFSVNYYETSILYECKDNDSLAAENYDSSSMFIVHKGSRVSYHLAPSFQQYDKTNYDLKIKSEKDGTIKDRKLTKDMPFTSQSAATAFITDHIANGSEWVVKK